MFQPTDCGEPQAQFEDRVCSMFEADGGMFEVLDRNMSSDPFEPDIILMDADGWVLNILCYYVEELPADGRITLFPRTFGMRKWVEDSQERPAFLVLGVGGTTSSPEEVYFSRFFNFPSKDVDLSDMVGFRLNWFDYRFLERIITDDFERMYSP
ncbi:MAG: hypothetical protein IJ026_05985 [Candidatus Methanomethylophilaceae archaeon]|nr:hypothetical protein [Candidatus Methanomethylophilaceae archaeon]